MLLSVRPARGEEPAPVLATSGPDGAALGLFTGLGSIGSPGAFGGAFLAGVRWQPCSHFAASLDLGYGLMSTSPGVQDRWWVIPAAALVIPAGRLRLDFGLGVGVGTTSGYGSWSDYVAGPFSPIWHYTVPVVRAHVMAATDLTRDLDGFVRLDVASLLLSGSSGPYEGGMDTTWVALWFGVDFRML
jgi:hypothetical protein